MFMARGIRDEHEALESRDFKPIYAGAACLMANCNPYNNNALQAEFLKRGGSLDDPMPFRPYYLGYPPSVLFLITPFAALPWPVAHYLWLAAILAVFVLGCFAIGDLCIDYSPIVSVCVLSLMVITSLFLIMLGQPTTLVIGFCCIAVWCFLRQRFEIAGVVCLALSLTFKPHMGIILLYFFLANAKYRKRAWQILGATVLLSLPGILWASAMPATHNWYHDMSVSLSGIAAQGNLSDPGPTSPEPYAIASLQSVLSLVRNDPRFYDPATWLICLPLFAFWAYPAIAMKNGFRKDFVCLAALAPLAMLPVRHRVYDTRLLLLCFPALAFLLCRKGLLGIAALGVSVLMTVMTFSQIWNVHGISSCLSRVRQHPTWSTLPLARPVPVACLLCALFYIACSYRLLFEERRELAPGPWYEG